eukprot:CAMPEP_0194195744 /NCGR_PEP_ID=MMETSP0154-20130528/76297_1 /TAXON_ID=1049557 /ORGANISM="Thalassiothrix antarctica, Strain L6-D1" /LENGTH=362 /DNA_ID=CAMNT_0038920291 /DNA_START=16 /DNA_END=1104 /DNA_ORIENTATION=-
MTMVMMDIASSSMSIATTTPSSVINSIGEQQQLIMGGGDILLDYAPAATSLFNNMKLPAAVVTAGMISLGFATSFPELSSSNNKYSLELRERCLDLKRLHIVVALIAVTSELIVVLWSAVEVNQLTERRYELAYSVWDLIQRDCDLAWSAVNSHFILGIIGFVTMLALRAYVMLIAAQASNVLMVAALSGTGAALCLMISIVNRGVQSGGGTEFYRYGNTILDLFRHYAMLLSQAATSSVSPGPLQLSAIILETVSLLCMANVLLFSNGKKVSEEEEECLLLFNESNDNIISNKNNMNNNKNNAVNNNFIDSSLNLFEEQQRKTKLLSKCLVMMENDQEINNNNPNNREDSSEDDDTSVSII